MGAITRKNFMANRTDPYLVKSIIWDWNGTLLDDRQLCVDIMDGLLRRYGLGRLDLKRYLDIFRFPIREYYRDLGFREEIVPFEKVATEFIEAYEKEKFSTSLRDGALETLEIFAERGQRQYILSASKLPSLHAVLEHFGIRRYFSGIYGLNDHYAGGKSGIGREMMLEEKLKAKETLYIGDTLHDAEVAGDTGVPCILVHGGHNSEERLRYCGCRVFRGLRFIPYFYH